MCGRVRLSSDVSEIKLVFAIPPERPTPNFPPSWNVAPTDTVPVVRYEPKAAQRSLDMLRWGLIPYWAKDIKVGFSNINAKGEGIESKPAFRKAFERRRCLVPVDNFYEWKKTAAGKQPYALALADRGLMALAGVWENWHSPAGEWTRSFAIITTTPNVTLGGAPEDIDILKRNRDLGVSRMTVRLPPAKDGEILLILDRWAKLIPLVRN